MWRGSESVANRRDAVVIAFAISIGIATYYAVSAIVDGLIGPLISVFIGVSHFELNSFTIGTSEFRYGAVLEATFTFALLIAVARAILRRGGGSRAGGDPLFVGPLRPCPQCTVAIPAEAGRCPYCTEVLTTEHR